MTAPDVTYAPATPRPIIDGILFSVTGTVTLGKITVVKDGKTHATSTAFGLDDTVYGDPGGPFQWGPIFLYYGTYEVDLVYASGDDEGESMLGSPVALVVD